jgi:iron complex outermembrane recepter protein
MTISLHREMFLEFIVRYQLLPFVVLAVASQSVLAENVSLPTISVEGASGEAIPYALPLLPVATPDTGDLIKRLPGANVNKNGPITSIAQYRGLFADRVNVLIDGVRLSQAGPNRMDSPLSYLPSTRLDDVSIFRGIAPVSSGIETIGGTITANSKKAEFTNGDDAEFHGDASAGYASNGDTYYAGVLASVANKNHRFQVAGSVDRGDDLDFDGGEIYPTEHERDTIGLGYGYQQNGNEFDFDIEHNDTGNTGTPALPMDIVYARGEHYKTSYKKELNNGADFSARLNYQDTEHRMSNYEFRTQMGMAKRHANADVEAAGINVSYSQAEWTFGFDADQAEHNTDIFNPTNAMFYVTNFNDVERDRYSVFGEWNGELQTDWKLHSGLRLTRVEMDADEVDTSMTMMGGMMGMNTTILRDRFNDAKRDQDEDLIDLSLVLTHTLNNNVDVEFGLARKERAPSYQERYLWLPMQSTSGLADGNNHVGTIDLNAETAYQAELGLDWHTAAAGFSPRVFYHHINDYIQGVAATDPTVIAVSTMMGGDTSPLQYDNVDAKLYGIDANWFVSLSNEWQLDGTVSYVRGKRRDTSDDLYRIAPLTARTMLSYVQATWRVGFEAETVAEQNKVSDENEEQKTSGYALFNLSGNYQPSDHFVLSAGVNNLFDRKYEDHLGGYNRISNSDNPDIAQGDRLPGVGRSAYIGANVSW